MTHPNDMTAWNEIRCQRDHAHRMKRIEVHLGGPTGYRDLTSVPTSLSRDFEMLVWDPEKHPVDGGPYCPAHDAVSATILSHRVWEPRETVLTLSVVGEGDHVVDMGAQIGWYSLLAASSGATVTAFEADELNVEMLLGSFRCNDWTDLTVFRRRLGRDTPPLASAPVRLAKIDLEGAEDQAIRVLSPMIAEGQVDHIMMEVSPVFADYYPDLVHTVMLAEYEAFMLPPKSQPPIQIMGGPDLYPYELDRRTVKDVVRSWHQEDVWFKRRDARW